MSTMFYEKLKKASWIKTHEAWADLKAAGVALAEIFWVGGDYWAMVEDVPSNPKTFISDSFEGLFVSDNYTFFKKEEFKKYKIRGI